MRTSSGGIFGASANSRAINRRLLQRESDGERFEGHLRDGAGSPFSSGAVQGTVVLHGESAARPMTSGSRGSSSHDASVPGRIPIAAPVAAIPWRSSRTTPTKRRPPSPRVNPFGSISPTTRPDPGKRHHLHGRHGGFQPAHGGWRPHRPRCEHHEHRHPDYLQPDLRGRRPSPTGTPPVRRGSSLRRGYNLGGSAASNVPGDLGALHLLRERDRWPSAPCS